MKRFLLSLFVTMLGLLYGGRAASAQLMDWAQKTDVICVASVTSVRSVPDGHPPFQSRLPVLSFVAQLQVKSILKGEAPSSLPLELYDFDWKTIQAKFGGFSGGVPFSHIDPKRTYLVFAQKQVVGQRFFLTEWGDGNPSLIAVEGSTVSFHKEDSPLLGVLREITSSVQAEKDKASRIRDLRLLSDYGMFLWEGAPWYEQDTLKSLRSAPDYQVIREAVQTTLVPVVSKFITSSDKDEKAVALQAAASLQVVGAIPELRNLAVTDPQSAAQALSQYKTAAAVPYLLPLLRNHSSEIKKSVIESLSSVKALQSVPSLINSLEDEDINVSYQAASALFSITGKMSPPTFGQFPSRRKTYIDEWKNWATNHQNQLDVLRTGKSTLISFSDLPRIPASTNTRISLGKSAPDFSVKDMDGQERTLSSLSGKKNLLLTFFPKCFTGGCTTHLSSLRDAYSAIQATNTEVWAVSVDPAEGDNGQQAFAKQWNFQFPLIPDADRKLSLLYGAVEQPTDVDRRMSVLIDKQGIVRWIDTDVRVSTHGTDMLAKIHKLGLDRSGGTP